MLYFLKSPKGETNMIQTIVFDMGNVLIRYAPTQFIASFSSNPEHQAHLLQSIFHSPEWIEYDRGMITKEALIEKACQAIPDSLHPSVSTIMDTWYNEMEPIAEMESLIRQLKKQRYSLYLLSNVSQDFYSFQSIIPGIDAFDGVFASSDYKCIKPEEQIYLSFFETFSLRPEECFFIDDLKENIEAAEALGMKGHVFDGDKEKLIQRLAQEGISL